ncbi:hypothetical protein Csa_017694 [Cucumis sativus]|uniref:Uncharacterized protein n=1 Tax=Cucumis sativus TaxID=3659 RepID=A0A0A0KC81_CUCSA|nr:hypothetical protein Csa_017694 [Cucumis sativus]
MAAVKLSNKPIQRMRERLDKGSRLGRTAREKEPARTLALAQLGDVRLDGGNDYVKVVAARV